MRWSSTLSQQANKRNLCTTFWYAITLSPDFYDHARSTPKTHRLALTIVLLAALSHMLGSAVILLINQVDRSALLLALLVDGLCVLAGYYFWTFTIWKIGKWLKQSQPDYSDLLSPIGFAYAPQVLNFLTLVPLFGRPIELGLAAWSLLAVIVAVRQGLDIRLRRAAVICLIGVPLIQLAIGFVQVMEQQFV
jgi:hypothetical protein